MRVIETIDEANSIIDNEGYNAYFKNEDYIEKSIIEKLKALKLLKE